MTEHRVEYDTGQHARIVPATWEMRVCPMCRGEFAGANELIDHMPHCRQGGGDTVTGEPLDRLDNRDLRALVTALRLYYGELQECGEHSADLEHVAKLSRRLADVSRTWVAEEAGYD